MKHLGIRISDLQDLQINDIASETGSTKSKLTRAALYLGLQQIKTHSDKDLEKGKELIAVADARAGL
ncbi:hypothetical protein [Vibrio casei]|uniref:hypothetical protein n=1 Tax=Vibrio casei TaxID=673372 RepID=UPI003F997BD7